MGVIDHDQGVVFFCDVADLIQLGNVAIHRKNTIRGNQPVSLVLGLFEFLFEILHICVLIDVSLSFTEANAIDDGCMIQLVCDNGILSPKKRFKNATIGIKTGCIEDRVFRLEKIRNLLFKDFMDVLCAADKANRTHPVSPFV